MDKMTDIIVRRVALYLRLSKEDLDKPTNEGISESIKNQELMLRNEVKKHPDWKIVGVYCDEDFSGAGAYRPSFEEMIKSCANGEIDIVLCKSQSRFSRDMEVVEKYIHNKFKEWNIRFVSLVDNADTENTGNKKSRQINALVNEWFLEDLSDNIKVTFRTKWKAGECTASFAKYGLIKDPKNKNHLLIDPIASEVLKQIAGMFLAGYGQDKIAKTLEEKNIPSPYEYKLMNGCKLKLPILAKEDKLSILKAGTYVLKIFLYNNYKQNLKNIKSVFVLGTNNRKAFRSRFNIKVRNISENLDLYYTTNDFGSNIDNFNIKSINLDDTNIWKKLKINNIIPNNVYYIASQNKSLDRLLETGFELEVDLKENYSHDIYKLFTKTIAANYDEQLLFQYEIRKKYKWSGRVIYNMLKDQIYNGTLIQGKTRRISYKNHKCIKAKQEHWISSENALEKIFDDKTWHDIQQKLNRVERAGATGTKHIFCGKVYCDICGNPLHKNCSSSIKSRKKVEYLLCQDKKNKWANCSNKRAINLNILKKYVIQSINNLLDKYYDTSMLIELYKKYIDTCLFKDLIESLNKEKCNIEILIQKKKNVFEQLYEDRITGIIDDSDFISLKSKYKEDIDQLKKRFSTLDEELTLIATKQQKLKDKNSLLLKYRHIEEITPILINEFIDKIKIGNLNEKNNTREIKIIWNL